MNPHACNEARFKYEDSSVKLTTGGENETPLKLAVIGAGPAGTLFVDRYLIIHLYCRINACSRCYYSETDTTNNEQV